MRPATIDDIPQCLSMGEDMHKESRYRNLSWNPEKVEKLFEKIMESPNGIFLVTENGNGLTGFLFGAVTTYYFGDDKYAFEYVLYVKPGNRGSRCAAELTKGYIEKAKSLGAKEEHIENTTMVETERTEKFFERMGFHRTGGNYIMET